MTAQIYDFFQMTKKLDTFPNRIRERRLAVKMTQDALATAIGVKPAQISRIELGAREITLPRLQRIAAVLGVAVGDLLTPADRGLSEEEARVIEAMRSGASERELIAVVADRAIGFGHAPRDDQDNVVPIKAAP